MKNKLMPLLLCVVAFAMPSMASKWDAGYSMILAPARYSVMQVMFDVISKRPAVLVSYQIDPKTSDTVLHVWNGASWNPVGLHDLAEMSFVQRTPTRAILIGDDDLLPGAVRDAVAWLPEVVVVRQLDNASLLNDFGRILKWNTSEWAWFSARYNLDLEDEAEPLRKSSWYDRSGPMVKGGASQYEPVPVISSEQDVNASSTTLPEPVVVTEETVEVVSETVVVESAPAPAPAASSEYDEIQEIVDTLEKSMPASVESAPAATP